MKIKTIAVSNQPQDPGLLQLKLSLIKYRYDFSIIDCDWKGFYTKINEAFKFAKDSDADYILFLDAHDVIVCGYIDDIIDRLNQFPDHDCIFSCEKACWPDSSLSDKYPECDSPWKYLNSGSYLFKRERLIEVIENNPPSLDADDQLYFTKLFLEGKMNCILDTGCDIFQSVAFAGDDDFSVTDVFVNNITHSMPVVLHGNGKTDMTNYFGL